MKRIISFVSFLTILTSCTSPPDGPGCRSLTPKVTIAKDDFGIPVTTVTSNPVCQKQIGEPACGYCVWSISEKEQYIGEQKEHWLDGQPWSQILAESITLPVKTYVAVKTYIIDNCKNNSDCNKNISKWRIKLDALDSVGK